MYSGIFDSHAHYDSERFSDDRDQVIQSVVENGVTGIINAGCDIKTSQIGLELTNLYDFFYCSVGIHPHEADQVDGDYIDKLKSMALEKKVVAIGEIGLDFHYDFSPREIQKRVFENQLKLANKLDLPVIIHSREATQETQKLLHKYNPKGVVHCFSSSAEIAKEDIEMGLYIGFTGVVTFNNARKTLEAVRATPIEKILLETDCPYMAPVPFRGKRCTSDMIAKTAEVIASIKGVSTQEMIDIAANNTRTLFNIE